MFVGPTPSSGGMTKSEEKGEGSGERHTHYMHASKKKNLPLLGEILTACWEGGPGC